MNAALGGMLQLAVYFFLLVGILAGGLFFYRNGFGKFRPHSKTAKKLEISESHMLGNRQFLVVAEYEDRKMLIGVCPGRIEYLCSLGKTEEDGLKRAQSLPERPE
jgi:flagellar biogenesis protein FliO